jgi:TM2 domain-containing membrane protein YozV
MSDELPGLPRRSSEPVELRAATDASLPPHPLDKRWYAHVEGKNYGPYSGHDIKRMVEKGQITEADFLCPEGGNAWTQAKNEPLLAALFRARAALPPPPATVTTSNGGTVVQVTNNIPASPNLAQAALLLEGAAAAKSPGIALVLSLLLPGVGQMYNGQVGKGIAFLIGYIVTIFIFLFWIVWIWAMIDAYTTAKEMNLRYQQRVLAGLM